MAAHWPVDCGLFRRRAATRLTNQPGAHDNNLLKLVNAPVLRFGFYLQSNDLV
jgi:hypothetical protein